MMDAPKNPADHRDRALDCEAALEPFLLQLVDDLELTGMSRPGAAQRLVDVLADPGRDELVAEEIESISIWAVAAGWREEEVARALASLAANIAIAEREAAIG